MVYALGSSVPSTATGATADGERPSFTALANYLRAADVMAWPMKANSRRRKYGHNVDRWDDVLADKYSPRLVGDVVC